MKKVYIGFEILFIFIFLVGTSVMALENISNESTEISTIENFTAEEIIANSSNDEIANCSEQLEVVIELYNDLVYDFRNKTNCGGPALDMLRNMNDQLSEERDILQEEVDVCQEELIKLKVYKISFYIVSIILFIIAMVIIFTAIKKE